MTFQILDDRRECYGIYYNGSFIYDNFPSNLDRTWEWCPHLLGRNINYGSIYCGGREIGKVGPVHLQDRYEVYSRKIRSFLRATAHAKINYDDVCLFEIIPQQHLRHYCEVKNDITNWVLENHQKPQNHQHMVDVMELCDDISQKIPAIDLNRLYRHSKHDRKARYLFEQVKGENTPILYDVWGSVTGRLTTKQGSFPILNLKKEIADCVVPTNDVFVQLDFNGAEIRTLISLAGKEQPEEDIHEWNMNNIYHNITERSKAKQRFFAWLYNPNSNDSETEKHYTREQILNKHYDGETISTPFGRKIQSDDFHALNYLLQSSSSDNCVQSAVKVNKFLKNKKSFVQSVVHDCVTIDMDLSERNLLPMLVELFSDTALGRFKTSIQIGHNLRDLEEVQW